VLDPLGSGIHTEAPSASVPEFVPPAAQTAGDGQSVQQSVPKGPASTGPFVYPCPPSAPSYAASCSRYCFQVAGIVGEASWMKM
jgi:hypothetical protein